MTDQQQLSTQTDASDTDSIEELPRDETTDVAASHPKSERTINLGPALVNTRPWQHFLAFVLLAGIDLAMNAAAGRAAASVGARLNRAPVTPKVLRIGALAGITKSALTTFYEVVSRMGVNLAFSILLLLVFSSFGISLILTAEVCNSTMDKVPKELLIAALIAAIPLYFETIRLIEPKPDANGEYTGVSVTCPCFAMDKKMSRPFLAFFLIISDAIGGHVFAEMASNQHMPISTLHAARSAGAVFGTITWLARLITGIIVCIEYRTYDTLYTVFGAYKVVDVEVTITDAEYEQMQGAARQAFTQLMRNLKRAKQLAFGALFRLTFLVPRVNLENTRRWLRAASSDGGDGSNGGDDSELPLLSDPAGLDTWGNTRWHVHETTHTVRNGREVSGAIRLGDEHGNLGVSHSVRNHRSMGSMIGTGDDVWMETWRM